MNFDELNNDNAILFAMKHYNNPQCHTRDDFDEDMRRFKYLKRLFKRYVRKRDLRIHLILNHLIILYNVKISLGSSCKSASIVITISPFDFLKPAERAIDLP